MEFNFRSIHERTTSTYFNPPPPNLTSPPQPPFFPHHSFQGGMMMNPEMGPGPGQGPRELLWNHPNPYELQEAMQYQRELEKERIRAEIIAEEIVRRRILEEEVRRELMMEREMGMVRFNGGYNNVTTPLLTNFEHHRERFISGGGIGVGVGVSPHREIGFRGSETRPFQRDPVVASGGGNGNRTPAPLNGNLQENKGVPAFQVAEDNKLIILAKTPLTAADLKRKAVTEPDGPTAELISNGSKKQKTKDDWSCALCRVSATSERGLNEHLQGKKHKSRERGLLTQKTGFGSPLPKKNIIPTKGNPITTPRVESCPTSKNNDEKTSGAIDNNSAQKKESFVEKSENGQVQEQLIKPVVVSVTATPTKAILTKPKLVKRLKTPGVESCPTYKNNNEKMDVEADNSSAQKKESSLEKSENGEVQVQPIKPVEMLVTATPKKAILTKVKQVKTPGVESCPTLKNNDEKTGTEADNNSAQEKDGSVEKSENGVVQVQPTKPVEMSITATPKKVIFTKPKQVKTPKVESLPTPINNAEKTGAGTDDNSAQKKESSLEKSENGGVQVHPLKPFKWGSTSTSTPKKAILTKPKQVKTPGVQSSRASRRKNKKAGGETGNNVTAKSKYKFWCEECKVGTQSLRVMDEHKGGRRHLTTISKLNQEIKDTMEANMFAAKQETRGEQVEIKEANAWNVWIRKEVSTITNLSTTDKEANMVVPKQTFETKDTKEANMVVPKQGTWGGQVEIKEADVWYMWKLRKEVPIANLSATDDNDKDKKPLQIGNDKQLGAGNLAGFNGVIIDGENKQLGAGNLAGFNGVIIDGENKQLGAGNVVGSEGVIVDDENNNQLGAGNVADS